MFGLHFRSQSTREVRAGTQAGAVEEHWLDGWIASSLTQPRPTCLGMMLSTAGRSLPYQSGQSLSDMATASLIKTILQLRFPQLLTMKTNWVYAQQTSSKCHSSWVTPEPQSSPQSHLIPRGHLVREPLYGDVSRLCFN